MASLDRSHVGHPGLAALVGSEKARRSADTRRQSSPGGSRPAFTAPKLYVGAPDDEGVPVGRSRMSRLRRQTADRFRHSSAGNDTKDSGLPRPAFPRAASRPRRR